MSLERLWKPLLDLAGRVAPDVRPTLVHRDIYPDNLVAREDGSLAAIVDFDMAEAWDPVADFPKLRWWIFEDTPGAEAAFLATYRARIPHHARFDERLTVVEVLELVNQIANAPAADDPLTLRARERLRPWLEG